MATSVAQPRVKATPLAGSRYDNWFFSVMAALLLLTVFVGFARTYFLAGVLRAPLPSVIIHIHGAAFSCWILFLIAQTALVSVRRVDIHKKLGLVGFGLASLMVVLGVLAATNSLSRNFVPPGAPFDPKTFYIIPMGDMLIFAVLVYFAYRTRFNPSYHKRIILLATIALMDAPTGRPPFTVITAHPFMDTIFCVFFLLLLVGYDLWSIRKVHRATLWAGLFLIIAQQLRIPIGNTAAWHALATWAQSFTH
jgi:hypothetical protein